MNHEKFSTPTPQETEKAPSLGERLTHDFLQQREIGSEGTRKALERVVERARNEFLMYGRVTKNVPEANVIADYIAGRIPKSDDPAAVYAAIMDDVTEYIKRANQKPAQKKAA